MTWFSPAPCALSSERISLDLGLRAADQYYRELAVPGLGRVWFVRQLSWSLGALATYEKVINRAVGRPVPSAIAHAIEALACKLEFRRNNRASQRLLGTRAFGRDPLFEVWDFDRLSRARNYVENTHRQATTRALRGEGGLGFANGPRFDKLAFEPVGRALAETFLGQHVGQGGTTLGKWLTSWIVGEKELPKNHESWWKALSPEVPSEDEKKFVRDRLFATASESSVKRDRLARALGRSAELPDIEAVVVPRLCAAGHHRQADEVLAVRAFGAFLDRGLDLVADLTRVVEPTRGGVRMSVMLRDSAILVAVAALRAAARVFLERARKVGKLEAESGKLADALATDDDSRALRRLIERAHTVLLVVDDVVCRGSLFRPLDRTDSRTKLSTTTDDDAADIEPDATGRTFRIANLHALVRELDRRGIS